MLFTSPTKGTMTFHAMFEDIMDYMREQPSASYKLIVGTDSHNRDGVSFVTAVIIHRLGKGARYYYSKSRDRRITSLRQRIFYETSLSLSLAGRLAQHLSQNGRSRMNVEIHCDVGQSGDTKDLVREIVGMVMGSGFDAKIKPDSYGASKVADKHAK